MIKVTNLCKSYPTFKLDNVSFELPKGYIMGFLGMNGAGKTTTLKSILNIVKPDSGAVEILGQDFANNEIALKKKIGFSLGEADYYQKSKIKKITDVYKRFFDNWNEDEYQKFIKRFDINESKNISELSTGMRVKYALALALSHNAELYIFDEPTSGLDPIARDEMLDLFHEIIEDGDKSILFSTHITSDLDKCADFVLLIKNGKIIANTTKDDLVLNHLLISGKKEQLTEQIKHKCIGYKISSYNFTGLLLKKDFDFTGDFVTETPNLEDIMIYYNKGANVWKICYTRN